MELQLQTEPVEGRFGVKCGWWRENRTRRLRRRGAVYLPGWSAGAKTRVRVSVSASQTEPRESARRRSHRHTPSGCTYTAGEEGFTVEKSSRAFLFVCLFVEFVWLWWIDFSERSSPDSVSPALRCWASCPRFFMTHLSVCTCVLYFKLGGLCTAFCNSV